jgi:hypothetical protein
LRIRESCGFAMHVGKTPSNPVFTQPVPSD